MTKDERNELKQIKEILEGAFKDKYDSQNGWKSARAVFEERVDNRLSGIEKTLNEVLLPVNNVVFGQEREPGIVDDVRELKTLKDKFGRSVNKIIVTLITTILAGAGALIWQSLK